MRRTATIFILDDDSAMLEAMVELVSSAGYAAAGFRSPQQLLAGTDWGAVDCLVSDFKMPEMSGIQLFEAVRRHRPALPLILVTGYGDMPTAVEAMKLGATTCLEKPFPPNDLLSAISVALQGTKPIRELADGRSRDIELIWRLAERERRVLFALAEGKTTVEIARELDVSERTVQFRRAALRQQLAIQSRTDWARWLHLVARLTPPESDLGSPCERAE